jgi:hypothetical protein
MKLIIVQRSKTATFRRLRETFADHLNVEVVFERRAKNRRRWSKAWNGRDYIVIQIAEPR